MEAVEAIDMYSFSLHKVLVIRIIMSKDSSYNSGPLCVIGLHIGDFPCSFDISRFFKFSVTSMWYLQMGKNKGLAIHQKHPCKEEQCAVTQSTY